MGRLCLGSVSESHPGTAKRPEPLCRAPVLPPRGRDEFPPGRALPLRRRSYGLMRQTSTLHSASALPRTDSLCRLLPAPAGPRTFPTLSLPIFLHVSGPLLRLLPGCIRPLLPPGHWPSPRKDRVGATHSPDNYFRRHSISKLQSFAIFRPAGLLATPVVPTVHRRARRPWLLHPRQSWFVASPRSGHANRPNPGN
jgi:hypothetical protein